MKLEKVVLPCRDQAACRRFYEGLGLTFYAKPRLLGSPNFAARVGETILELSQAAKTPSAPEQSLSGVLLAFSVVDLSATLTRIAPLCKSGLPSPRREKGEVAIIICDPEGHHLRLSQPIK